MSQLYPAAAKNMRIKLILADNHPVVLHGLTRRLSSVSEVDLLGTASTAEEMIALLERVSCHVLVMDYSMSSREGGGMAMMPLIRVKFPDTRIVIFTAIDNIALINLMRKLGAYSVINKKCDIDHVVNAIQVAHAGGRYFPPAAQYLGEISLEASDAGKTSCSLTSREAEVLRLYVSGSTLQEIATQFERSKQTIYAQKNSAMRKLGIARDADLLDFAIKNGLIA